jgi:hypothetical protein
MHLPLNSPRTYFAIRGVMFFFIAVAESGSRK